MYHAAQARPDRERKVGDANLARVIQIPRKMPSSALYLNSASNTDGWTMRSHIVKRNINTLDIARKKAIRWVRREDRLKEKSAESARIKSRWTRLIHLVEFSLPAPARSPLAQRIHHIKLKNKHEADEVERQHEEGVDKQKGADALTLQDFENSGESQLPEKDEKCLNHISDDEYQKYLLEHKIEQNFRDRANKSNLAAAQAKVQRQLEVEVAAVVWTIRELAAMVIQKYWRGKAARLLLARFKRQREFFRRQQSVQAHDIQRWRWQDTGEGVVEILRARARYQREVEALQRLEKNRAAFRNRGTNRVPGLSQPIDNALVSELFPEDAYATQMDNSYSLKSDGVDSYLMGAGGQAEATGGSTGGRGPCGSSAKTLERRRNSHHDSDVDDQPSSPLSDTQAPHQRDDTRRRDGHTNRGTVLTPSERLEMEHYNLYADNMVQQPPSRENNLRQQNVALGAGSYSYGHSHRHSNTGNQADSKGAGQSVRTPRQAALRNQSKGSGTRVRFVDGEYLPVTRESTHAVDAGAKFSGETEYAQTEDLLRQRQRFLHSDTVSGDAHLDSRSHGWDANDYQEHQTIGGGRRVSRVVRQPFASPMQLSIVSFGADTAVGQQEEPSQRAVRMSAHSARYTQRYSGNEGVHGRMQAKENDSVGFSGSSPRVTTIASQSQQNELNQSSRQDAPSEPSAGHLKQRETSVTPQGHTSHEVTGQESRQDELPRPTSQPMTCRPFMEREEMASPFTSFTPDCKHHHKDIADTQGRVDTHAMMVSAHTAAKGTSAKAVAHEKKQERGRGMSGRCRPCSASWMDQCSVAIPGNVSMGDNGGMQEEGEVPGLRGGGRRNRRCVSARGEGYGTRCLAAYVSRESEIRSQGQGEGGVVMGAQRRIVS